MFNNNDTEGKRELLIAVGNASMKISAKIRERVAAAAGKPDFAKATTGEEVAP